MNKLEERIMQADCAVCDGEFITIGDFGVASLKVLPKLSLFIGDRRFQSQNLHSITNFEFMKQIPTSKGERVFLTNFYYRAPDDDCYSRQASNGSYYNNSLLKAFYSAIDPGIETLYFYAAECRSPVLPDYKAEILQIFRAAYCDQEQGEFIGALMPVYIEEIEK